MLNGSCLCGAINYEIDSAVGEMGHCHCSMCRKAHGAAFGTYARVERDQFRFTSGEGLVGEYLSSPGITRTFCNTCGSTLQWIPEGKTAFGLAVGTLDSDPGVRPSYQIWTRDKAPWWQLEDGLDTHETQ